MSYVVIMATTAGDITINQGFFSFMTNGHAQAQELAQEPEQLPAARTSEQAAVKSAVDAVPLERRNLCNWL